MKSRAMVADHMWESIQGINGNERNIPLLLFYRGVRGMGPRKIGIYVAQEIRKPEVELTNLLINLLSRP
jgi:hypothetical protein